MAAPATDPAKGAGGRRFGGLLVRVASAVVLGPLLLAAVWYGYPWIDLAAALAAPVMIFEWTRLTRGSIPLRLASYIYSLLALAALLWLRHQPASGRETILWVLACVWATDVGAYFVGRAAGGAKLAPRISPGKTWSGLIGGMAWAAAASAAMGYVFDLGHTVSLAVVGAVLAVVAQAGDLLESAAKRRVGVKDSGRLIPGHGGLLDRVDGLIAVLVAVGAARFVAGGAWPWT